MTRQSPIAAATNDRFRAGKRLWNPEDDDTLRALYPDMPTPAVARQLRRTVTATYARAKLLSISKSAAYLASPHACRLRRGDHVGARFRYPKGHVPANKGLRRPGWSAGRMRETQFKKGTVNGHAAAHLMPIGSTRLVDGYVYVKVAAVQNVPYTVNWLPLHIIEWERVNGPLPEGHCLWFKDGNRLNVDVANLELHTRAENMRRNSVHNLPSALAQTVQLLGALHRQIRKRESHAQKQNRRSA
jgi:hypothetical protein